MLLIGNILFDFPTYLGAYYALYIAAGTRGRAGF